jgi:hypothetical protein
VAAVPLAVLIRVLWTLPRDWSSDSFWIGVGIVLLVVAMLVTLLFARGAARRCGFWRPWLTTSLLVAVQAAVTVMMSIAAPFRPGLLSVLLYWAPAMCLAAAVLRGTRAALYSAAGLMAALVAVAFPVHLLQQAVVAGQWQSETGVPSRAYVQVVSLPGTWQYPYQWDSRTHTLSAYFISPGGYQDAWAATETVTAKGGNPCATGLTEPTEWLDAPVTEPASCIPVGPGQWERVDGMNGLTAFVLREGGLTITLTAVNTTIPVLESAVLAHHPAGNAALWSRTSPHPQTVAEWTLL